MKKLVLFVIAIMATTVVFSQAVQRNKVVLEVSTGTWCQFCPGAAVAADQLVANGKQVAVIEYHNGDAYTNAASNARNSYYNTSGYPTGRFDGTYSYVGGALCPGSGTYNYYLNKYNTAYAVPSPLTIDISGTNAGDIYTVVLSIHKVADVTGTDLRAMLVLTETNISSASWPPGYNCMTHVNFVERLMAPDQNGTSFSFASGDMQIIVVTLTKTASWVGTNCSLIAFVQDRGSKKIYNGIQVPLNSLPAPVPVSFIADTTSGCAPLTVNYTDQSSGVDSYQWDLPGGTPSSSAVQNPSVTYNTGGAFDATLTAWNSSLSRGNIMAKPSFLDISSVPDIASTPTGTSELCQGDAGIEYTTIGATGALSYVWEVLPVETGTLTGTTLSATLDLAVGFSGSATVKVKGVNNCGEGVFSEGLPLTIRALPLAPAKPTGTSELCQGDAGIAYTTTGATDATSYVWEVLPVETGTITGTTLSATLDLAVGFSGSATVKVKGVNNCGESTFSEELPLTIKALPLVPAKPTGVDSVNTNKIVSSEFTTTGGQYAETYAWFINPAAAGTFSGTGTTGTITWTKDYKGNASISVKSINTCGESEDSEVLTVLLYSTLGIGNNGEDIGITLYPNPNDGKFTLSLNANGNHDVNIVIYNSAGVEVYAENNVKLSGKITKNIDLSILSNGIYHLKVAGKNSLVVKKFVIQK